jgi:hypothetical protein
MQMELVGNDANQVKADPNKENGNTEPLMHHLRRPPHTVQGNGLCAQ